jgi:hypothetical protein
VQGFFSGSTGWNGILEPTEGTNFQKSKNKIINKSSVSKFKEVYVSTL